MKKLGAYFLVLILIASTIEGGALLSIKKGQIHQRVTHELKHKHKHKDLVQLIISKGEQYRQLIWHKAHEFEYKGQMYDIVDQNETKDSYLFTCYADKEESKIVQLIKKESQRKQHPEKQVSGKHKLTLFYTPIEIQFTLLKDQPKPVFYHLAEKPNSINAHVLIPPECV